MYIHTPAIALQALAQDSQLAKRTLGIQQLADCPSFTEAQPKVARGTEVTTSATAYCGIA